MAFSRMMAVLGAGIGLAVAASSMVGTGNGTATEKTGEAVEPPPPVAPGTLISGHARVVSGDGLTVGGRQVRLFGIDAPEPDQTCTRDGESTPCGRAAADALAARVKGKAVHCTARRDGGDGLVLAVCRADGHDLADLMVSDGWAVAVPEETDAYVGEENRASDDHRGLWGGEFLHPAEWRAKKGS